MLATFLLLLVFAHAVSAETAWQLDCSAYSNMQKCAMSYASKVAEQYPGMFTRRDGNLVVMLHEGRTHVLPDPKSRLDVVSVHQMSQFAVVREQYYEGNTWHVLSLKDGTLTNVGGFPVFAPNGMFFFAIEPLSEAYNSSVARIYVAKQPTPTIVWDAKCRQTNWGPSALIWLGSERVSFEQTRFDKTGKEVPIGKAVVSNQNGIWKAAGLSCRG